MLNCVEFVRKSPLNLTIFIKKSLIDISLLGYCPIPIFFACSISMFSKTSGYIKSKLAFGKFVSIISSLQNATNSFLSILCFLTYLLRLSHLLKFSGFSCQILSMFNLKTLVIIELNEESPA